MAFCYGKQKTNTSETVQTEIFSINSLGDSNAQPGWRSTELGRKCKPPRKINRVTIHGSLEGGEAAQLKKASLKDAFSISWHSFSSGSHGYARVIKIRVGWQCP